MNDVYVKENAIARQRLIAVTAKLSTNDLDRSLPKRWSVATKLAHLAFWDFYWLSLIERWEQTSFGYSPANVDAINNGVLVLSRSIPPTQIVALVRQAADVLDRKLETITPELEAAIENAGYVNILRRAVHRQHHLDQIEEGLRS